MSLLYHAPKYNAWQMCVFWRLKFIVSIKKRHTFDKHMHHNEPIARPYKFIGVYRMKKFKKLIFIGAVVLIIAATSVTALAATGYSSPAEILAGLTGQTADSILAEKTQSNTTYGTIAKDAGVLDQFKAQMLELKKAALAERVTAGQLTQERADAILAAMEANMANCDGIGSGKGACGMGGMMNGSGKGCGKGYGGMGTCTGAGLTG